MDNTAVENNADMIFIDDYFRLSMEGLRAPQNYLDWTYDFEGAEEIIRYIDSTSARI